MALSALGNKTRGTRSSRPAANAGSVGGHKSAKIPGKLPTGGIVSAAGSAKIVVIATRQGRGTLPRRQQPVIQCGHLLFGSPSASVHLPGEKLPCFVVANPFDVVLVRTVGRDFSGRPTHIGPRGDNASRRCRARPIHLEQFHDGLYRKHRFRHADDRWRERSGFGDCVHWQQ